MLDKSFGAPRITKDGVTVAKEIELADKFENMGAQMVREVASKSSNVAGDGTTTATVLSPPLSCVTFTALWRISTPRSIRSRASVEIGPLAATNQALRLSVRAKGPDCRCMNPMDLKPASTWPWRRCGPPPIPDERSYVASEL